ncbi:probable periplasmic lipid esterase [Aromatoleum aromaticum EbN1]|uniref:Probable periplasmic lipid esterase n=1 Tax=Aromatoleum aromaticum (strain DSM 19018 / LMG 30748 / EbN1) TaxID=76114 RepID=Q5NY44_AROAE|nr:arylesterase [Aromatoleum aromaticum]CAI10020.1 probable periplasmic lipid esterase [Aromatoleum aromaticum EbN1]
MLLRSIVIFFFAIMVSGAGQAATILVWGDSLSAGYGLRAKQDWPTLLQTRLEREGFRHTVINGSVSGETSSGGRSRLPAALDRHEPDLLILELGANDGLRGLPPRLLAENLAAMIEAARSRGTRVLLIGMQMPPNYGPPYRQRFEQTFADVAREHKVPLVPFLLDGFAERHEMFQSDGIHPTAEAQELIVDTVWKQLAPMLKG